MIRARIILSVFFVVLFFGVGNLWGQIITIDFTAEVSHLIDSDGLLDGQINFGDIITGSYTYDSATVDSEPDSSIGDYWHNTSPYGVNLSVGGFVFQTDPDNVDFLMEIGDNTPGDDFYLFRSYNNLPLPNGVEVGHISLLFRDDSGTTLSSDALPTTLPVLEDWPDSFGLYISVYDTFGQPTASIHAQVTSVHTPEPATILLLGLGGVVLCRRRK